MASGEEGHHITDNANGVILDEAIPFLVRALKSDVCGAQGSLHFLLPHYTGGDLSRHWRIIHDRRAVFPTDEDWKVFDKDISRMVDMWDNTLWEVNELLRQVPG